MEHHQLIGDIRGKGLMIGIELVSNREKKIPVSPEKMFNIVLDASTHGLLLYYGHNFLVLFPPLIINKQIANEIIAIVDKILSQSISTNVSRAVRLAKEFAASQILKAT